MNKLILSALMVFAFSNVAVAKTAKKSTKPAAGANAMKIDTAKSEITWTGSKVVVKSAHTGTMKLKSGQVDVAGMDIKGGFFEIDMTSLKNTDLAGNPKQGDLEGHLKSADFFDVAKYPTSTFKITSVKALKAEAGQPTHEITGDLTLKGTTKPVTFPATVTTTGTDASAVADLKIDRTLWDVRYGSDKFFQGLGDKVIANDITLKLNIVATK